MMGLEQATELTDEQMSVMRTVGDEEYGLIVSVAEGKLRMCAPKQAAEGGPLPAIALALMAVAQRLATDGEWVLELAAEMGSPCGSESIN